MDRLACANLPAFPLQLLLRRHPEWVASPVAVVAEDKPQAMILWVSEKARQAGVRSGFRYAAGSSLVPDLYAGTVPAAEIEKEVAALKEQLRRFTPGVESSAEEPGVFWLNGIGLNLLYPSLEGWARAIHADIEGRGFWGSVVVGFMRFGTYAVAKARQGTVIFEDLSQERAAARTVSLDHLGLEPDLRDALSKLGIGTVGAFLSLPAGGLYERFGPEAYRLYRRASGELWEPFELYEPEEPVRRRLVLDDPETDTTRLLFLIRRLLHPMLAALADQNQALMELLLRFLIYRMGWREERVRPAAPTLDSVQVLDLVRLRLETMKFSAGVIEIELTAKGSQATAEQLRLFAERPARDLDAANRALARLRAEFGDQAVVRAKLTDGHLPEARFTWEPLEQVQLPNHLKHEGSRSLLKNPFLEPDQKDPRCKAHEESASGGVLTQYVGESGSSATKQMGLFQQAPRTLVRRMLARSIPLPSQPRTHDDGWLLLGPKYGAVERLSGPYLFSGGWWNREIHREYYFAETRRGDILWVYYDRVRRRWFLQGYVE